MEQKFVTEDERNLICSLLAVHLVEGVRFGHNGWTPEQCVRLMEKIGGPGKTILVQSQTFGVDASVQRAEEQGCG